MIYLLDVNVLLALGYTMHVHYEPAWCWLAEQRARLAPTDGHLVMVAKANGARLVTLDRFIPDAEFIPNTDGGGGPPLDLAMRCRCTALMQQLRPEKVPEVRARREVQRRRADLPSPRHPKQH